MKADIRVFAGLRDRNLSAEEIKVVWDACQDCNAGMSDEIEVCVRTIIACGQRVQETLRMNGEEVDIDKALWKIPAHKTKGKKRDHTIPLPAIIIPDLRKLKEKHGDGPLFRARSGSVEEVIDAVGLTEKAKARVKTLSGGQRRRVELALGIFGVFGITTTHIY